MNENTIPVRADLRSRSLDFLRYPLAMAVLVVHLCNEHSEAMQYVPLLRRATSSFIGGQSVPIYFFIAGYVFFLNTDLGKKEYRRKLRNRFHSLLVPYLSWNLLAYAVATLASAGGAARRWLLLRGPRQSAGRLDRRRGLIPCRYPHVVCPRVDCHGHNISFDKMAS